MPSQHCAKISVCMPIYNGEAYLAEAVESVLAQSFGDFELIVVDDCSQDQSVEIIERYAKTDPRIKLFRNTKNLGLVGNWNRSASLANGEWIKFFFQDDLLRPECLQTFLAHLDSDDKIAFCQRDLLFDDEIAISVKNYYLEHEKLLKQTFALGSKVDKDTVCGWALTHIGINIFGEPTAMLIRREVFFEFGPCNTDLIMICDIEYAIRIATNTGIRLIPQILATFRAHGGSASAHGSNQKQLRHRYIDHIIWLHEILYAPAYENLRKISQHHQPTIALNGLLVERVVNAEEYIKKSTKPNSTEVFMMEDEMTQTLSRYPGVRLSKMQRLISKARKTYWRLRNKISPV